MSASLGGVTLETAAGGKPAPLCRGRLGAAGCGFWMTVAWRMTHQAWNKLQHALRGNGAALEEEEDDLDGVLAEVDEDGQLELDVQVDGF